MLERITKALVEALSVDLAKVTLDVNLKEDLKIDSLDSVELVLELEIYPIRHSIGKGHGKAFVDGKISCEASISFTVK